MASIWVHHAQMKEPAKVLGNMPPKVATTEYRRLLAEWKEKGIELRQVFDFEHVAYRDGKLVCSVFIEFHSPPSAPEPGQPKRSGATS